MEKLAEALKARGMQIVWKDRTQRTTGGIGGSAVNAVGELQGGPFDQRVLLLPTISSHAYTFKWT